MSDDFMTKENCELKHKEVIHSLADIVKEVKGINTRLFKDNGNISIQTRLDRHNQTLKIISWTVAILCSAIVLNLGEKIVEHFVR